MRPYPHHSAYLIAAILLGATALPAPAQSSDQSRIPDNTEASAKPGPSAPESAPIVLPEEVLKVPDIAVAPVASELPGAGNLRVPDMSVPLPDQGPLHIPDQAFDVPLPEKNAPQAASRQGSSVYNTGSLGVGTMNHLSGAISVYKLGDSPRFRLQFSHEGLDGFSGKPAGTGYFSNSNEVGGWLATNSSAAGTESMASFRDNELGLQNNSDYYSVGIRTLSGYTGFSYHPDSPLSLGARVEAGAASRLFSLAAPATSNSSQTEYRVSPSLSAGLNFDSISLELRGSYGLRLTDGLAAANNVNVGLFVDASLPASFLIRGDVGTFWTIGSVPDAGLEIPWSIELAKNFSGGLGLSLSGGYRVTPMSFSDLWSTYPVLHIGDQVNDSLVHASAWFGKAGYTLSSPDLLLTTKGSVEVAYRKNVVDITGYSRTDNSYLYRQTDMWTVIPGFELTWSPVSLLSIRAGLTGNLLNRAEQEPLLEANGTLSISSPQNRFGGALTAVFDMFGAPVVPNLSASLFARISDGVELDLNVDDILSPLLPEGRPVIGSTVNPGFPFIAPGFRITLSTHISL
ncbi:hypothetical protein [Salinispira pacifica]